MRKIFYISDCPIPDPELNIADLTVKFKEKFSHIPFPVLDDVWYTTRFEDAIEEWNHCKLIYSNDEFTTGSKMKMRLAATRWTTKRAYTQIQYDLYESMYVINEAKDLPPSYNSKFIVHKLDQLLNEISRTSHFNFNEFARNQNNRINLGGDMMAVAG